MFSLIKKRNFSLFWFGETISVIGDQISLIAFPWLILQMTNSAALTGLVFAVQGIPRAALMLAGGALVDRTSPRLVMLVSNGLRMFLVVYLAYMISQNTANITSVFLMAFAFGVAGAYRIEYESVFRCIALNLHLSLAAVGLTAIEADKLAVAPM